MFHFIKSFLFRVYRRFLQYKFKMSSSSASMLASEFYLDYKKHVISYMNIFSIHSKGFTTEDWLCCNLNNNTYKKYLSSAQYIRMHPLNGVFSRWIDDKLTLKYLTYGTKCDFMPEYYYQINDNGTVLSLPDLPFSYKSTVDDIVKLVCEKKHLLENVFLDH